MDRELLGEGNGEWMDRIKMGSLGPVSLSLREEIS